MNAHGLHRAIVSALAIVAVAGCGGDRPELTRAQLVEAANAICAQDPLDVDRLKALRPPLGDEDVYRRYVAAERQLAEAETPLERAAADGKAEGYAARLGFSACVERHNASS